MKKAPIKIDNKHNLVGSINENNELKSFRRIDDINNENIKNSNKIDNIPKINENKNSNSQINPSKEQSDSKIITDVDNTKSINPNHIKVQIEERYEKKDEEMFKLYKEECDKIIDGINNEDKLYNSLFRKDISEIEKENTIKKINKNLFEKSMDYSYFYIILKELKLLELLILNQDDAGFFIENKDKIFDFNKLTMLVKNKKIQEKMFTSRLYKEYAVNKCII